MKTLASCLFIVIIFLASCKKGDNPGPALVPPFTATGSISGAVIPLGAAKTLTAVYVQGSSVDSAAPDSSGRFSFAGLPPGTYRIHSIAATGYIAPPDTSITVVAGINSNLGVLWFAISTVGTGSVSGTVSPVGAAATVSATNQQTGVVVTAVPDNTGAFSFVALAVGGYTIHASAAAGYIGPADTSVGVIAGQGKVLNTLLFTKIDPSKASISGTVSPAAGGLYKNYTVRIYTGTSQSYYTGVDSTGFFTVANLLPGDYRVYFTGPTGYAAPNTSYINLAAGQHADFGKIVFRTPASLYSIIGTVSPLWVVSYIYATDPKRGIRYYADVNTLGKFNFSTLPEGSYTLTATPVNGFMMPPLRPANAVDAQADDMGTIVFTPDPDNYKNFISWSDNGVSMLGAGSKTCNYISPSLTIAQQETTLSQIPEYPSSLANALYINLDNVYGTGTYTCRNTATSTIIYKVRVSALSASPKYYTYSTVNSGGAGSVQITSVDTLARTITGTFSGTLVAADANTPAATKVITNGIIGKFSY